MIRIFADGALVHDSRVEEHQLVGLTVSAGLNVGGTAEIVMPLDHPAYDKFVGYKTLVAIYRDGELRFRGRALYYADTFHGQRTVTCEGELCFLGDSISRPYNYQDTPAKILEALVENHNSQVEAFKRFSLGEVTVEDAANLNVQLQSDTAETVLDTLNKLVENSGGYIIFTDDGYGGRAINWLTELTQWSGQSIEFGENLLDFTSTGASTTTLATGIIPYGAMFRDGAKLGDASALNKNLVDPENVESGYYKGTAGQPVEKVPSMTYICTSNPIRVKEGQMLHLQVTRPQSAAPKITFLFMDINGLYISEAATATSADMDAVTAPAGAAFFHIWMYGDYDVNFEGWCIVATNAEERLTIASAKDGNGKDYILDDDAVAVRGIIMTTQTWDEVKSPSTLLKKAREYLNHSKLFITSLELTALDLSYLDNNLGTFAVGDWIRVTSAPHGVDDDFQLASLTEDLLDPANSKITLGKTVQFLTHEDVAGDFKGKKMLESEATKLSKGLSSAVSTAVTQAGSDAARRYVPKTALEGYATSAALQAEVNARAGVINKVNGVVNISGGAPVKILGGKVEIDGSEIHFGKEARFKNDSGIRIADKDGNYYYVLRVDSANSCVVGNDYANLYLRGKDGVYLYKGGAAVTSDRRHKNGIEELPEAYEVVLDKLTPVRFKYNGKGDTYHVGFVAQEVEAALTAAGLSRADFGGFVDVSGDGTELGIAYDEFIGLLLAKIRKLEKRLDTLEE